MNTVVTNNFLLLPVFGICIFIFSYFMSDKIFEFIQNKMKNTKETVMNTFDKMFIEVNEKKITITLMLFSFGFGGIILLSLWSASPLGSIFLGTVVTVICGYFPKVIVRSLWEKRCNILVNQMLDGMTIMGNGVKAGLSVPQSMERVTDNMSGPLAQEFTLILNKVRIGMSLEEALSEFGERIPRPDVQMFVTSVNILKETGGNLAETFATIVDTIRSRQKIEKKIEAMTAQGVMQGVIITLVPFILLIVFAIVDPSYIKPLFSTALGWVALGIMLFLQIIGGVMIKKIVTIKV